MARGKVPVTKRVVKASGAPNRRTLAKPRPHFRFMEDDINAIAYTLMSRLDRRDGWEVYPNARAVCVDAASATFAIIGALLRGLVHGGIVFWIHDARASHLHRIFEKVGELGRAPDNADLLKKYSKELGTTLKPAVAVETVWAERPIRALVVGDAGSFLEVLATTAPGSGVTAPIDSRPNAEIRDFREAGRKKLEHQLTDDLSSRKPRQSEEAIKGKHGSILDTRGKRLDEPGGDFFAPSEYWAGGYRGRPREETSAALVAFIRKVYGPLMATHRDEMRANIYRHDKKLYQAILDFERHSALPEDIAMPTRSDIVVKRLRQAFVEGLEVLDKPQRRSVTGKLRRLVKPGKPEI